MAIVGIVIAAREDAWKLAIVLLFPLVYAGYMSLQRVMIVRNDLVLVPFLAIFAAHGGIALVRLLRPPPLRWLFAATLAGLLCVNAAWLVWSAQSIKTRGARNDVEQLARYLDKHPRQRFRLSRQVAQDLIARESRAWPNVIGSGSAGADAAIFYSSEVEQTNWRLWTANRRNYVWTWFGPYEVNFNYYPSWEGDRRILVMPMRTARRLGNW
jgi:hypothetical protein